MDCEGWGPDRWANHLSLLLNAAAPPDRHRFDVGELALEISKTYFPADPIVDVAVTDLGGCEGALLPSESGTRWGIYVDRRASPQRRRFTAAHELGHYLVHRRRHPDGFRCDEAAVDARDGREIEREADRFASALLMPLDDFRLRIPRKSAADFDLLGDCAERYGVSLIAATLRWLRDTDRRAIIVVSRDGYMKWAWSSDAAFRSRRYFRTSGAPVEVPPLSMVGRAEFTDEARSGIEHPPGVWFDEPATEMSLRAERYDLNYTLLMLGDAPAFASDFGASWRDGGVRTGR